MTEFLKGNSKIDQIVTDATSGANASFEHMREVLKAQLVRDGVIAREVRDGYGVRQIAQPQDEAVPEIPKVSASYGCERVVYPGGNVRLVITGPSEAALDEQENQLRALIQGQR